METVNAMLSIPTVKFALLIYIASVTIYMERQSTTRELKPF